MNTTSAEKKQRLANIVEQQKKLQELALANGIDEVIVNMGATANANELYEIMYPNNEEEDDESEIDEEEQRFIDAWKNDDFETQKEMMLKKIEEGKLRRKKEEDELNNMCDCCVKGWDKPNEFGQCECICNKCFQLLCECKYECKKEEEEEEEHKAIFKHLIKMKWIEFNIEKDLSNIK